MRSSAQFGRELLPVLHSTVVFWLSHGRNAAFPFQPGCMSNLSLGGQNTISSSVLTWTLCFRFFVFVILMNYENDWICSLKFFQWSELFFSLLSQTEIVSGSWSNPGGNKSVSCTSSKLWFGKAKFTYKIFQHDYWIDFCLWLLLLIINSTEE